MTLNQDDFELDSDSDEDYISPYESDLDSDDEGYVSPGEPDLDMDDSKLIHFSQLDKNNVFETWPPLPQGKYLVTDTFKNGFTLNHIIILFTKDEHFKFDNSIFEMETPILQCDEYGILKNVVT